MLNLCFSDVDWDPRKAARDERKERVTKNEKKHQQNVARSNTTPRQERKDEIERTLATTRQSTASMGKFDKKLDGEKKIRGVKRKVRNVFISNSSRLLTSIQLFSV